MPKKFDTTRLDPAFPEKVKAAAAGNSSQRNEYVSPHPAATSPYSTAEFPSASSVTEEETRRFGEADFQSHWVGNQAPGNVYRPAAEVVPARAPEKWLIALPYVPFYIGLIAGLVLLLVMPKTENKVRFHAAQGLAAHVGILIITTILGVIGGMADLGSLIFSIVTTILLLIFAFKAWRGKPVHIESVDDLTNWLEEKIGPIKSW